MSNPEDSGFIQYPISSNDRNPPPADNRASTITMLDLFVIISKNLRMIVLTTIITACTVVVFSIYTLKMPPDSPFNPLPNVFRPTVSIMLQDSQSKSLSSSATSQLGLLAGLTGVTTGSTTTAVAVALLEGNTVIDQVIDDFDLMATYKNSKFPRTEARMAILKKTKSSVDVETNILTISYEDTDPERAAKLLASILTHLETRYRELTMDKTTAKRIFLKERLTEAETDLKNAQNEVIEFQKKYGIINLDTQTRTTLQNEAQINSAIFSKELELQNQLQYLREDDPQIVRLRNDIKIQQQALAELQNGFKTYSATTIAQNQIPEIAARFINIQRDLTVQETIYTMLRQQYETAKIDEADNTRRYQIVEPIEIPEVKAGPGRGLICITVTMSAFILAVMGAFIREYLARAHQDPEESKKMDSIRRNLSVRKNR